MKKIVTIVFCLAVSQNVSAMLKHFIEQGVTTNSFLDPYGGGTCPATATSTNVTNCGNDYVNDVIGTNFAAPPMLTYGVYYMYNNFGTYIEAMSAALDNTAPPTPSTVADTVDTTLESWKESISSQSTTTTSSTVQAQSLATTLGINDPQNYPMVGIYQLELSTCQAAIDDYNGSSTIVTPNPDPVEDQVKLVARLRYNGGVSYSTDDTQEIFLLSQHALCLSPTDKFNIVISSDIDTTSVTPTSSDSDTASTQIVGSALSTYFQYGDHTSSDCLAYQNGTGCPRKVRLELAN
jgi:hypothetical protein